MRLLLALVLVAIPAAQDQALPDYETFAAQVKMRLATDQERQSGYMFSNGVSSRSSRRGADEGRGGQGLRGLSGPAW